MKKVVVMTTGGTIAMKYDPVTQGLIPAVSGDDLIEAVPALREIAEVEVVEFSNVPSGHITPQMMFDLAKMADRYAEPRDRYTGRNSLYVRFGSKNEQACLSYRSHARRFRNRTGRTGKYPGGSNGRCQR